MPWSENSKILNGLKRVENFELLRKMSETYRDIRYRMPDYQPALHYFNLMKYVDEMGEPIKIRYPRGFSST